MCAARVHRWITLNVMDDAQTFEWEGIQVQESKRGYLDLLMQTAATMPACQHKRGKARLYALARQCDIDRTTIRRELEETYRPRWETLDKLVAETKVPLERWLVQLGVVTAEGLAKALGQEAPALTLSASDEDWLRLTRSWPPARSRFLYDLLSAPDPPLPGEAGQS